ncbi:serine O-acetyltransferase [uncultured Paludibaculum sp.]|uniref:serine O-acetyltransferase n=1 Tax=uncultured Paludibaculum sp. TaxID=1765020 RepID=UPI002AABB0DC|nr:serine O-acetyltransferase [uncultured Paludibaculum sp.]
MVDWVVWNNLVECDPIARSAGPGESASKLYSRLRYRVSGLVHPGFHAIVIHRASHRLYAAGFTTIARFLSQCARWLTGIEIHPGARIGRRFFIDHGMGVVIGETTIIGDDCLLYQGVTLGGTGKESGKRHPTLGNRVIVGSGAKILGNILIADDVRVGAGSVVLKAVPPHSTVVGVPGRVVRNRTDNDQTLEHAQLPDPQGQAIDQLSQRIQQLEVLVHQLAAGEKAALRTNWAEAGAGASRAQASGR